MVRIDNARRILPIILTLILVSGLLSPMTSMTTAQVQRDINLTIMLEKVRSAVVLIITIVKAVIIWEDFIPQLQEVGLDPAVEVGTVAFGSGFFVSSDGYIITNGHVVNDFQSEFQRVRPLLLNFVETYFEARIKRTGQQPSQEEVQQLFRETIRAYLTNRLKIQDYTVDVRVGVGRVVSGFANIGKLYTARIAYSSPFEMEDLALLKIEIKNAPSIRVAQENIARAGERVWALGYPGAVTFHQLLSVETLLEPTITEGTVSGYRLKAAGVSVLQSDVTVTHGNSGGPVVNSNGVVVAVTSFGSADPSGSGREVPGFNFFVPASYVYDIIRRFSVNNVESETIKFYEEGLRLFYQKQYRAAIERFQIVKNLYPGFPFIDDYITDAQKAILRGEEASQLPIDMTMIAIIAVGAAVGGGAGYIFLKRRKETAGKAKEQQGQWQYGQQWGYQQPQQPPSPDQTPWQSPGPQQQPRLPPGYKFCINCGKVIPEDSAKCPYCNADQQ
ncbi:MAG: trypsin-like peptidase domain-containing protein [Sulfolobales archaeon]|nr:trypsin-like peptidase domain-containing protein [Sulfolobales archaeon]